MNEFVDTPTKKLSPAMQIPFIEQLERTYTRLSVIIDSRPEEIVAINKSMDCLQVALQKMIESNNQQARTPKKTGAQNDIEKMRVKERLESFDMKNCRAWKEITNRFGPSLNQSELLGIAEIIAEAANIKVDREAKRRKEVIVKWFEENIETVLPILERIELVDEYGQLMCPKKDKRHAGNEMTIEELHAIEDKINMKINSTNKVQNQSKSKEQHENIVNLEEIPNNII